MNKTREIECYASKDINLTDRYPGSLIQKNEFMNSTKAKLIIEIPEKEIKLTESMLDEVFEQFFEVDRCYDDFKQKLFGDSNAL